MSAPDRESIQLPEEEVLRLNGWAESALWVYAAAVGLLGLFMALFLPARHPGSAWEFRGLGLVLLGVAADLARSAMAGIWVRPEGILLRTRFRAFPLTWQEIASFQLGSNLRYRSPLVVVLKDGRKIRAVGFEARFPGERARAERLVAELEARRRSGIDPVGRDGLEPPANGV